MRLALAERQPVLIMKGTGYAANVVTEAIKMYKTKLEEHRFENFGDDLDDIKHVTTREKQAVLAKFSSLDVNNMLRRSGFTHSDTKAWSALLMDILLNYQDIIIIHKYDDNNSLMTKLLDHVFTGDLTSHLRVAMRLNLVHLMNEKLVQLTTRNHQRFVAENAGAKLFFEALRDNKVDFVRLLLNQQIDLMESDKTTNRIYILFQASKTVLVERDWHSSTLQDIIADVLHCKKLILGTRGSYLHVKDPLVRRRLNPIQTLILWALMTQKFEMAEILWRESSNDGLLLALVASAYCGYIARLTIVRNMIEMYKNHSEREQSLDSLESCSLQWVIFRSSRLPAQDHSPCLIIVGLRGVNVS